MRELDEVVDEADRAARERDEEDRQRGHACTAEKARNASAAVPRMSRPPITGVPCFDVVAGGAFLADVLAELVAAQELDELGAGHDRDEHRHEARDEDADHG